MMKGTRRVIIQAIPLAIVQDFQLEKLQPSRDRPVLRSCLKTWIHGFFEPGLRTVLDRQYC